MTVFLLFITSRTYFTISFFDQRLKLTLASSKSGCIAEKYIKVQMLCEIVVSLWLEAKIFYWQIIGFQYFCAYLTIALMINFLQSKMKFHDFCFLIAICITCNHFRAVWSCYWVYSEPIVFIFQFFILFWFRTFLFIEWAQSAFAYQVDRTSFSAINFIQWVC